MNTQYQQQFLYLVCRNIDEELQPVKVFNQEHDAVVYGKTLATEEASVHIHYSLYRQELTKTGTFEFVRTIKPLQLEDNLED